VSRAAGFAICLVLSTACGRPAAPAEPREAAAARDTVQMTPDADRDNILAISSGAAVVSRTGEGSLEYSAVQAIDSMVETSWTSPPHAPDQTLVFSLAGPTRLEALGATTLSRALPGTMIFETSSDGRQWSRVSELSPKAGTEVRPIPPAEAQYIRVVITGKPGSSPVINSLQARGRAVAAPRRRSLEGCWEINGEPARFVQNGARISGVIGEKRPTLVDGGTDGSVARLMWRRGPAWGYAVVTSTPDGDALSGATFHEDPQVTHYGRAWFGTRCTSKKSLAAGSIGPQQFAERGAAWALFGVAFDESGAIDPVASKAALDIAAAYIAGTPAPARIRIVAHEFGSTDPAANRRVAAARIDALRAELAARGTDLSRVELIASGSDRKGPETRFPIQRLLWSRVDLELVKPPS